MNPIPTGHLVMCLKSREFLLHHSTAALDWLPMVVLPSRPFWTFAFYKKLEESEANCVYKDDNIVVLKRANGDYLGVAWNIARKSTEQGKEKCCWSLHFRLNRRSTAS